MLWAQSQLESTTFGHHPTATSHVAAWRPWQLLQQNSRGTLSRFSILSNTNLGNNVIGYLQASRSSLHEVEQWCVWIKICCIDPWFSNCNACHCSNKQTDLLKSGSDIEQCKSNIHFTAQTVGLKLVNLNLSESPLNPSEIEIEWIWIWIWSEFDISALKGRTHTVGFECDLESVSFLKQNEFVNKRYSCSNCQHQPLHMTSCAESE